MQPELLQIDGESFIGLRDPARIHDGVMLLSPLAYRLTQLMDGLRSRSEIVEQARARWGVGVTGEQLDQLLNSLEEHYALDNARSRGYLDALPVRPAAHAGGGYPAQPERLQAFLDELLQAGPSPELTPARAYLIPHIDLSRGKESYAAAWNHLRPNLQDFDLFVVLGISHAYSENPFILTRKDFETPLGRVETDLDLVSELALNLNFDPFLDEFNHLGEHSIEFQLVFLQHLCKHPFKVLPILCGSFQECLEQPGQPESKPGVQRFFSCLEQLLAGRPKTCWIASVDLAHVGQRFGGAALTIGDLKRIQDLDEATMKSAVGGDAGGFLEALRVDAGERNYCGTSAIYTLLQVLRPASGKLLHYQQCNESQLTSTVTVASACYP